MKVEVKESNQVKKRPFPKLMIDDLGQIVFALEKDKDVLTAIVISNGKATTSLGEYCESYAAECFKDFEGSITLSND